MNPIETVFALATVALLVGIGLQGSSVSTRRSPKHPVIGNARQATRADTVRSMTGAAAKFERLENDMDLLKRNYAASVINGQEQWTLEIKKIGFIHVHNKTASGKWTYEICTAVRLTAKKEYDTKEAAYQQALQSATNIIAVALSDIQFEALDARPAAEAGDAG